MIRNASILLVSALTLSACVGFTGGTPAPVQYYGDGPGEHAQSAPTARPVASQPTPIANPVQQQQAASPPASPVEGDGMSEAQELAMLDKDPQQPTGQLQPVEQKPLPPAAKADGQTRELSEAEEMAMLDKDPRSPAPVNLQPDVQQQPSAEVKAGAPLLANPGLVDVVPAKDRPPSVKVGKGDTLFSLTEKYQVALAPVIKLNHLTPPYHLNVGQQLKLPPPLHYRVQKGDTLYSIARKYGMDFQSLAGINGIDAPYAVSPDMILILPTLVRNQNGGWKPAAKTVTASKTSGAKTGSAAKSTSAIQRPAATSTFIWPIDGKILSSFGGKAGGMRNDGINIAASKGEPVHAAGAGTVIYAGSELKNYGVLILIRHANGWVTAYAHNDSLKVHEGDVVKAGDVIALAGSTGSVDTPQLHFETRKGVKPVNPMTYLPKPA